MAVNKTKLEEYAKKVYNGDRRRYKEWKKQKKDNLFAFDLFLTETTKATKGKRVAPSSSQGKQVIEDCKRKCVICGKKYDADPVDFQIHHVNGDRTKTGTTTKNLVLLCHSCHKKVHDRASAKLRDYINSITDQPPEPPFTIPSFDQPKWRF